MVSIEKNACILSSNDGTCIMRVNPSSGIPVCQTRAVVQVTRVDEEEIDALLGSEDLHVCDKGGEVAEVTTGEVGQYLGSSHINGDWDEAGGELQAGRARMGW